MTMRVVRRFITHLHLGTQGNFEVAHRVAPPLQFTEDLMCESNSIGNKSNRKNINVYVALPSAPNYNLLFQNLLKSLLPKNHLTYFV